MDGSNNKVPAGLARAGAERVLWVAVGRQRVGKTTLLSAAAQFFRARGAELEVWNADQQNRGHALSAFFPDAQTVPEGGVEDARRWIEERLQGLAELGAPGVGAVLDSGGGLTGFSRLVEDVAFEETLDVFGIRPVGLFVVGPEDADLDYLEHFAAEGRFLPTASVVVLNEGLVLSGRAPQIAFEPVLRHRAVQAAVGRGARVVFFPPLGCLAGVARLRMTYPAILTADYARVRAELGLFDLARVRRFWERDLPEFFAMIPSEWLPRGAVSAGGVQREAV